MLDVGQGDGTIVHAPDAVVLVDAGPSFRIAATRVGTRSSRALRAEGITRVDAAILSHAHRDHYGGLGWLAKRGFLHVLFENGSDPRGAWRRSIAGVGDIAVARDTTLAILHARIVRVAEAGAAAARPGNAPENNRSLVASLSLTGETVCFAGDAEHDGVSKAGFSPARIVEWDRWCCDTIRENRRRRTPMVANWPEPFEGDVRDVDFRDLAGKIELVTGGPPCQPFSLGGKHRAHGDARDMWPQAVRVVRETKPKAFIFENVKGLKRGSFATYLAYIVHQLTFPELVRREDESWEDHLGRLERHLTGRRRGPIPSPTAWFTACSTPPIMGFPSVANASFSWDSGSISGSNGPFPRKPIHSTRCCGIKPAETIGTGTRRQSARAKSRRDTPNGRAGWNVRRCCPGARFGTR